MTHLHFHQVLHFAFFSRMANWVCRVVVQEQPSTHQNFGESEVACVEPRAGTLIAHARCATAWDQSSVTEQQRSSEVDWLQQLSPAPPLAPPELEKLACAR